MRIIISPAKKMNVDEDVFEYRDMPIFLNKSEELMNYLKSLSYDECKSIWKCSDKLAELNYTILKNMKLTYNLTPALFSYEGIQYQCIGAKVLDEKSLEYLQEHLRILSGFYGVLKPFDGVVPYRLEMQAKLLNFKCKSLYEFWSDEIAKQIFSQSNVVLNLASKEYSRCVQKYLNSDISFITCTFAGIKDNKIIEKGTLVKMARGEMVRYIAENKIENIEDIKHFDRLGYKYVDELSDCSNFVFIKDTEK